MPSSPEPPALTDPSPAHLQVGETTGAGVTATLGEDGDALLTVTLGQDGAHQILLTGTCWSLHRLVIDLDRQLTTISRRSVLG